MSTLALNGGKPVIGKPLPPYHSLGAAERGAVQRVLDSGCLSGFYGSIGQQFLGGNEVCALEREWRQAYSAKHAISVNSATSGLIAAIGALAIGPGDEVIVPPYTMSASVVAPLFYGAIPVFADIEDRTFCIDVEAVAAATTPRTRCVIAVNLFGHPAELSKLRRFCDSKGLALIEDSAQAPRSKEGPNWAGTIGHIGVYSLNYHKHIHSGEGGICITADDCLAERLQLIRNHAENIVEHLGANADLSNLIGQNYRMTELTAAVARAQLGQVETHVAIRERLAERLSVGVANLGGLAVPHVRPECRHNYYCWSVKFDPQTIGVERSTFCAALAAEGFPIHEGYVRPLYLLPLFQRKIAIGRDGFPFNLGTYDYRKGLCPVAERLYERELFFFEPCAYQLSESDIDALIEAVHKVHQYFVQH